MELVLDYKFEDVEAVVTYKLSKEEIDRSKKIIQRYLAGKLCPATDYIGNNGFYELALEIKNKIVKEYGVLSENRCETTDIYRELSKTISIEVLKESLEIKKESK